VVDVQDLPREAPWSAGYLLWWIIDQLYYLHAFFVLNADECAKLYDRRVSGRTFVVPMAAHHDIVVPKSSVSQGPGLTLGYIGTISKSRGFPELIELVKRLRTEGVAVDLVINGSNPENIDLGTYSWVRLCDRQPLEQFSELLRTIDVGVIPYVDKEYWGRMSITKMATYMAAGLPILCLHLTETSNIIAKWDCGISAEDWSSMETAIRRLCHDKSLVKKLSENARIAAVKEYNWAKQSERLGEFIGSLA
jgi:glycosyltransferase involved in cell wall biosynthesis